LASLSVCGEPTPGFFQAAHIRRCSGRDTRLGGRATYPGVIERVKVTIYTDPGCPFGFNAQRQELQLAWHYGADLAITRKMIVLNERSSSFEERGLTREMIAANNKHLRAAYGMPMVTDPPDHLAATIDACRAFVGARTHDQARADLLLRCLRRRAFSDGQPLDEPRTLHAAGADAGITAEALERWLADEQIERSLRDDMAAATRAPLPEALALAH
jgi:2-hydroxychromene-2-carboxylate isomerase